MIVGCCIIGVLALFAFAGVTTRGAENKKTIDILFTHDTHSHLNSFITNYEGKSQELGGFARIKTLISEKKQENPDTLVLDAGDFSMGTMVQTVYETEAAEMRMLGELEVEATTLGNHEFDYLSKGLANMLNTAKASVDTTPELLICNVDWEAMEAAGLSEGQKLIFDAFENYEVKDYTVFTKGEVKVAVIGVFGKDALACAPTCELLFKDPVEAVKETVETIKEKEDVDMIVCISHSGTTEDKSTSEDDILAEKVPDLDVIISGHTHTEIYEPYVHGSTYIVSCGEYGKRLGSLSLVETEEGRWSITDYDLGLIDTSIPKDEATQEKIDSLIATVDENYLQQYNYTREQVLVENDVKFSEKEELETVHEEHNLGNIMADAFRYAVENLDGYTGDPVDVAVVPSGCVRDSYPTGNITVEDVFNSYSLGIGADGIPGYPLLSVYLTGSELKMVAEIDASVSDLMPIARLYLSGMNLSYNPNRLILNKTTGISLYDSAGNPVELEDDKLYHVVGDLYTGQMLGAVTKVSYGLLTLTPKFADGTVIENFEDAIITENGKELKAWEAIARYMQSFEDTDGDGISNIPSYYEGKQGRKIVEDEKNPVALLKNPSRYALMMAGAVVVFVALLAGIIFLVVRLVKRRRK
jgi:2',3'-cyclic-nucleotide 2'-phosphodiesterase (5'-nucleotidase family)